MAKFDDAQKELVLFHGGTASQELHTPAGRIPAPASDAPIVPPTVVAFNSAGKQITSSPVVTPFQRIAFVS